MGVIRRKQLDQSWVYQDTNTHEYTGNNATKQVLIGHDDGAHNFEVRVFTIPPRGFSSLDNHAHDHGVLVLNGRARVQLGSTYDELNQGDSVYIPGSETHQFENLTDEPFVFLCVIPPKPIP